MAGRLGRFYILLEITTESGVYHTEAAVIERGATNPIPAGVSIKAAFPFTMRPLDEWGNPLDATYGQYQITVREGDTAKQVPPLLPDTLPLEVQLWPDNSDEMLTSGIVQVPATWKTLSSTQLMAGQQVILSDAVDALVIPSGTEVATPLGNFSLSGSVTFDGNDNGQVHLVIDVVGRDEAPDVSLQENSYENSIDDIGALSLAFRLKPSGATAITAYTFVKGDEEWMELCDLLTRRDLNHNQAMRIYGFVTLLQPEDSPFSDYLENGAPFLIGLKIAGGTFDGETVVLPWPGDYNPPAGILEPGGSEGNDNNAGSGGGDSTEEGQRPDLPEEPEQKPGNKPDPPSIVPPSTEGNPQVPEQVPTPSPPEITVPKQLQTDSGDTEKPTNESSAGEKTTTADQPFISPQPQSEKDVPAVGIQKGQTADGSPSDQALSPQAEHPSAQMADTTVPAPSTDEKEIDAGQRSDNMTETENTQSSLPMAATAAIVLVGGGTAVGVGVGTASGAVSGSGFWGRLLNTLRKLFSRR